jgi:hypothetical protein
VWGPLRSWLIGGAMGLGVAAESRDGSEGADRQRADRPTENRHLRNLLVTRTCSFAWVRIRSRCKTA